MRNLVLLLLLFSLMTACGEKTPPDQPDDRPEQGTITSQQGITFSNVRARAGSAGGMSAVYFNLENTSSTPDTLMQVASDVAQLTEVHESYEQDNGAIGMRKIPFLELNKKETVNFEPGSYHVMLIRLNEALVAGDTVNLEVTFRESGTHNLAAPVVQDP